MQWVIGQILPAMQLARIALVFTAIADIWLIALLSRWRGAGGGPDLPGWAALVCTAAVAVGLYAFGMVLNDLMDVRRDRTFAPDRPLASGRIGLAAAIGMAIGALLLAVAGSVPLGRISTLLCLVCAALVLFYDGPGKHLPGVGVLTLGVIRAVHMLIAAPGLGYLWPVWLTLSHVIAVSAAAHRLEGKRPALRGGGLWLVLGGWAFLTVGLIGWMSMKGGMTLPQGPRLWLGPAGAAAVFAAVAFWTVRRAPHGRAAGGLLIKRGLLWLIVYDAAWLAGAALWWQAALVGALLPAALGAMAGMRQLQALAAPSGFRQDR